MDYVSSVLHGGLRPFIKSQPASTQLTLGPQMKRRAAKEGDLDGFKGGARSLPFRVFPKTRNLSGVRFYGPKQNTKTERHTHLDGFEGGNRADLAREEYRERRCQQEHHPHLGKGQT